MLYSPDLAASPRLDRAAVAPKGEGLSPSLSEGPTPVHPLNLTGRQILHPFLTVRSANAGGQAVLSEPHVPGAAQGELRSAGGRVVALWKSGEGWQ